MLKYMDMYMEDEQARMEEEKVKMYINYLSQIFAQPQQGKPDPKFKRAKEEFEKMIKPAENQSDKPSKPKSEYVWDDKVQALLDQQN